MTMRIAVALCSLSTASSLSFRLLSLVNCFGLLMIGSRLVHAAHFSRRPAYCGFVRQQHPRSLSSSSTTTSLYLLKLRIPTADDMEDVGAILSRDTRAGDVILLGGDLGAGKTCLCRGFVRARTGNLEQLVTSPTYLLSNTYDAGDVVIHHMDLYRLAGDNDKDLDPLDMQNVLTNCIALIEWPSRLGRTSTPRERLDISFTIHDDDTTDNEESVMRHVTLTAHGDRWEERLQLLVQEGFVDDLILD